MIETIATHQSMTVTSIHTLENILGGISMGSITICLPDELEILFRRTTALKYGDKKGRLSRGAAEAIYGWCMENLPDLEKIGKEELIDLFMCQNTE
jgi:hypothetical protein